MQVLRTRRRISDGKIVAQIVGSQSDFDTLLNVLEKGVAYTLLSDQERTMVRGLAQVLATNIDRIHV